MTTYLEIIERTISTFLYTVMSLGGFAIMCGFLMSILYLSRSNFFLGCIGAFIASSIGYTATLSRESAIGGLLPVLLTGFGIAISYSVIEKKINKKLALTFSFIFSIALIWGLQYGSTIRSLIETKNSAIPQELFYER